MTAQYFGVDLTHRGMREKQRTSGVQGDDLDQVGLQRFHRGSMMRVPAALRKPVCVAGLRSDRRGETPHKRGLVNFQGFQRFQWGWILKLP
ncbi:MAG: hypothetical protein Kow00109_28510 [Acidobacteriota bacterium]